MPRDGNTRWPIESPFRRNISDSGGRKHLSRLSAAFSAAIECICAVVSSYSAVGHSQSRLLPFSLLLMITTVLSEYRWSAWGAWRGVALSDHTTEGQASKTRNTPRIPQGVFSCAYLVCLICSSPPAARTAHITDIMKMIDDNKYALVAFVQSIPSRLVQRCSCDANLRTTINGRGL